MLSFQKLLGANIKKYRKQKGISQEKFAELLNVAPTTVSNIETGKNFITSQTLQNITKVLEIEAFKLFIFNDNEESKTILLKKLKRNIETKSIRNDYTKLYLLYEFSEKLIK